MLTMSPRKITDTYNANRHDVNVETEIALIFPIISKKYKNQRITVEGQRKAIVILCNFSSTHGSQKRNS